MAKAQTNKSAQIRDTLKANPDKSGAEIAKELRVSTALVYKVKARMTKKRRSAGSKKKAAGKRASSSELSKAQMIRDVAKELGKKVRPRDVVAKLAEQGVKVAPAQVSIVLSQSGYRRKRRGKKAAAVAPASPSNGLNVEALIAAKALIAKVGSVKVAEEALNVLKKLG
jgi:transposase